jgi:hypothetical protein
MAEDDRQPVRPGATRRRDRTPKRQTHKRPKEGSLWQSEQVRKTGFEIAQKLDREKTPWERLMPEKSQIVAALWSMGVLFVVFLIGCWLAGNPFEATQRIPSTFVKNMGWAGTNEWSIIWSVVFIAMAFEFMDATAGMGFGTAITPLLAGDGLRPQADRPGRHDPAGGGRPDRHLPPRRVRERGVELQTDVGDHQALALHRHPGHSGRHDLGDLGLRHLQVRQGLDHPLRLRAAARHGLYLPLPGDVPRAIASTGPR